MRSLLALLAFAFLAGCFSPDPPEGIACSETGQCPPGQRCELGVCRSLAGVLDGSVDALPPIDAIGPPDGTRPPSGIGVVCERDADCPDLFCFLDGPGRNDELGFCTTPCVPGPEGDMACTAIDAGLICFATAELAGVCAISCTGPPDCPGELDCQVGADVQNGIICDVSDPGPMPSVDGGGPTVPPGDAGG